MTVVIDAGHGGKDPGAVGKISYEKNIALKISLHLGRILNENLPDVKVVYTRKDDSYPTLNKRAQIANSKNADLFISIHCDSFTKPTVRGTSTFIMGLSKSNANFKGRKAKTKQKNEIVGSTSKIYAQKGTGNARHASRKAPIFVGGGIAHGPKGESNYKKRKINKSEKKNSISSLITEKNKMKSLIILNDFVKDIKKTKEINNFLVKFDAKNSLLILDKNSKERI